MPRLSPRRILTLTALALLAIAVPASAHGGRAAPAPALEPLVRAAPETLPLPNGFQPEGIAAYDRDEVLVGSIPTGALYRLNVRTGEGALLAEGAEGRAAIGIKVAHGKVFVSGGPTGRVRVQSAADGSVLREEQAGTVGSTFVNDVTLTREAVMVAAFLSWAGAEFGLPGRAGGPRRRRTRNAVPSGCS